MSDWEKAYRKLVKHIEKCCLKDKERSKQEEDPVDKAWFHGASVALQLELQISDLILGDLGLSVEEDKPEEGE